VSRKTSPAPSPESGAASFTLTDADITSQRAVPRSRLPGGLGAGAAAQAFGQAGGPAASDHDGPSDTARSAGRAAPKPAPDGDG
jgi:hypothetical protein